MNPSNKQHGEVQTFVLQLPEVVYSITHKDGHHEMVAFLPVVEVVGR